MFKINKENLQISVAEFIIVVVMWLLVVSAPFIIGNHHELSVLKVLFKSWMHIVPFFLLFLINHLFTVPAFLFKRKRILFVVISAVLISLFSVWQIKREINSYQSSSRNFAVVKYRKRIFDANYNAIYSKDRKDQTTDIPLHGILNGVDLELDKQIRMHKPHRDNRGIFRLETPQLGLENERLFNVKRNPKITVDATFIRRNLEEQAPIKPISFFSVVLMFIVFALSTGVRVVFQWVKLDRITVDRENKSIKNELDFLRNQVNPHFFMNTLNNIHSLIDIDSDQAQSAIVEFSKLMRYMLYDSNSDNTKLASEIEFLENYVNLMKLRYTDTVKVDFITPSEIPNIEIPPLLFTSIVENSFKHGISYQNSSYIRVEFSVDGHHLVFICSNSNFPKVATEQSGIGLTNTRKRLDLIYKKKYDLDIITTEKDFTLTLRIPYDKMYCNR